MLNGITSGNVRCLFQVGTPLKPYAVVEESLTHDLIIVQINAEIYDFFLSGGSPVCEPTMIPPTELASLNAICVFQIFIGAENAISFAVVEASSSNELLIVQISEANFCFFKSLGVHVCPVVDISGNAIRN
jgi:hypothetical protein